MSIFVLLPCCFYHHGFVVQFQVSKCKTFDAVDFSWNDLAGWSLLWLHARIRMVSSISVKNAFDI